MPYEEPFVDVSLMTESGPTRIHELADADGERLRVLEVGNAIESATYLGDRYCEPALAYTRLFDAMFHAPREPERVLMLGGGGCSYPKHLIAAHPACTVDVVDYDEAMFDLAREFFYLDRLIEDYDLEANGRLQLIVDDAYRYLAACAASGIRYDAIVNDCYVCQEPDERMSSHDAAELVHELLGPDGSYVVNVVSALKGRKARRLAHQVEALSHAFRFVQVVPLSPRQPRLVDNVIVVASDERYSIPGACSEYGSEGMGYSTRLP